MRLLLLTNQVPFPVLNGEDLRVSEFVKQFASRHEIDLIAYGRGGTLDGEARQYFREVHLLQAAKVETGGKLFRRILDAFDPRAMFGFDERVASKLHDVLRHGAHDWLWIPAWQMMPYAEGVKHAKVLLDVMDDGVLELAREVRCSASIKHFAINAKRLFVTYLFERKYFSSVKCCCLVTDEDAQTLKKVCPSAHVVAVPNGVDADYFSPQGSEQDEFTLVFEGNMSFGPSVDAIVYFCKEIFPTISAVLPRARLSIVGRDPTEEVRNLRCDKVLVTGSVDDVRPYLDRAAVFVCPMRKGAGIKNKILQAWAMAKPVVATSVAAAGLSARQGENILVADDPGAFADHVVALLQSPQERMRLGQLGRETVLQHHSWHRQAHLLESRLAVS